MKLESLGTRIQRKRKRVGRGPGSGLGKTCGRGEKGAGSRSGYKRRYSYEGGGLRYFMRLPTRGFTRGRFNKEVLDVVNLNQIDQMFADGEVVTADSLRDRGFISGPTHGVKLLGHGELTKKVAIELTSYSKTAIEKLEAAKIKYSVV